MMGPSGTRYTGPDNGQFGAVWANEPRDSMKTCSKSIGIIILMYAKQFIAGGSDVEIFYRVDLVVAQSMKKEIVRIYNFVAFSTNFFLQPRILLS